MKQSRHKYQSRFFIISGPSGVGKSTLLARLVKRNNPQGKLVKSVSLTTRPKRPGEKEARDYFFVSDKEFRQRKKAHKILEWTRYLSYDYGTPKEFIEEQRAKGKHVLFCLDIKGAFRIKRLYPQNAVTIFIAPPSIKTLNYRIKKRCRKTDKQEVCQRLRLARQELKASRAYDYCLLNQYLPGVVKELQEIILKETGYTTRKR